MSIDQELLRVSAECDRLIAERDALAARLQKMRKALERISRWNGEFPPTGIFLKGTDETMSYGAAYGSNGERDYMRHVAGQVLATPDTSAQILVRRDAAIWMEAAEVCEAFTPTYVKDSERWLKGQNGNPDIRLKDIAPHFEAAFEMEQVLKHGSVIHQLTGFDKCGKALRTKADELLKGLEKAP